MNRRRLTSFDDCAAPLIALSPPARSHASRAPPRHRARRAADDELADERRQLVQPALLAADAIDRSNVANLKGVWRTQLDGSGVGPQYSGEAQPLVVDGVVYVADGRERRVRARRRQRRDPLGATARISSRRRHRRVLRLDEPRRRASATARCSRPARRQARRARREDRRRRVVRASGALAGRLLDHERAAVLRRPRDHGLRGRRARRARPRESVRRARRQARLDVLHDPRPRRARQRHLAARQRALAARRRHRVAHAGRRSRARPHLLLDRQSGSRLQRRRAHRATTSSRRRSSPST